MLRFGRHPGYPSNKILENWLLSSGLSSETALTGLLQFVNHFQKEYHDALNPIAGQCAEQKS
jgi:hypothetical protein